MNFDTELIGKAIDSYKGLQQKPYWIYYMALPGLSVRVGGGGFLPALRVWCAGYEE